MDITTFVISLAIPGLAIFLPVLLNSLSASRKAYRTAAAPVLDKLLIEMLALRKGSYPFQTIREDDIYKLFSFVNSRNRKSLMRAYNQYLEAHRNAITNHWHNALPSDGVVFFTSSLVFKNTDGELAMMEPLLKELSR